MTDRIEMINRALLRIGANPLVDELDPAAPVHVAVYNSVLERLAAGPFTFFKMTRRLVRLTAVPVAHYAYAFRLPTERCGALRGVWSDATQLRSITDYDIRGSELLCDHEQIWIVFPGAVGPDFWPGDFRELFTLALMAELALSVREDRALHDRLYTKAFGSPGQDGMGGMYAQVLAMDNQAVPGDVVGGGGNPLIDVR